MRLPEALQQAIENEVDQYGIKKLAAAREELTKHYRDQKKRPAVDPHMQTDLQRLSYLATRFPATYAAVNCVMKAVQEQIPHQPVRSLLDLGAGPGTAMWAAANVFPELEKVTLIEQDLSLMKLGKRLALSSESEVIHSAEWIGADLAHLESFSEHDLVIFSYSIGELSEVGVTRLIELAWKATNQALVVIEPGTPVGFERIRRIRSQLIEMGGHLIAPCPHQGPCPMAGGNWCHFPARVERTSLHKKLKGGSLGYEDEKFSYIAFSKKDCTLPFGRVMAPPAIRSGHVNLSLCAKEGLEQITISKRNPDAYKKARKSDWGSAFSYMVDYNL